MSDNLQRLRDAFPLLGWTEGYWISGHVGPPDAPLFLLWVHVTDGRMTRAVCPGPQFHDLGPDPIDDLRAILEAEGARLGREADERAETARLLGWPTPPSAAATSPDSPPST